MTNAHDHGFSPAADGSANQQALQRAVDCGGAIVVTHPGTYALAGTVYLPSDTALTFAPGVFVKKVPDRGPFSHALLNKGALTKTWDHRISVHGLHLLVNGVDVRTFADVFGLHGQVAFHYARDVRITGFRCYDLGKAQYGIHVCTFEDLLVQDVIVHGAKDGVHLGRGRRFVIRDGVFGTGDDAIALNAHDYDVGNPELGWIENGLVENCHDLNLGNPTGFFCRILAGAWSNWHTGMEVQKSDTVVYAGRLYRVRAEPDGAHYRSLTPPTHSRGFRIIDNISWEHLQDDVTYTAGVRNVTFRNIFLEKPRIGFSVHFDNDRYSRSYYPGSPIPSQSNIIIENLTVLHDNDTDLLSANTPIDVVTIARSTLRNSRLHFRGNIPLSDPGTTYLNLLGCVFAKDGPLELLRIDVPGKQVTLATSDSVVLCPSFLASIKECDVASVVRSDLPGLRERQFCPDHPDTSHAAR